MASDVITGWLAIHYIRSHNASHGCMNSVPHRDRLLARITVASYQEQRSFHTYHHCKWKNRLPMRAKQIVTMLVN